MKMSPHWRKPAPPPPGSATEWRRPGVPYGLHPMIDMMLTIGSVAENQVKLAQLVHRQTRTYFIGWLFMFVAYLFLFGSYLLLSARLP